MNIALISEHASPLATLGAVDAGGQNVHVANLAAELGELGHDVRVYTRRDSSGVPAEVEFAPNVRVVNVTAGPPVPLAKDDLYPLMPDFAAGVVRVAAIRRPDVLHSHFWMSGIAARKVSEALAVPWVHTFHALGAEKRRYQGSADTSPPARIAQEQCILEEAGCIIATSSAEIFTHRRNGAPASKLKLVPCGVALPRGFPDVCTVERRERFRIITVGRLVERKGVDDVIRALCHLPETELLVVGGPAAAELDADADAQRLMAVAAESGVADRVRFCGSVNQALVPSFLRSADVAVCAPWYEPFGIVALEAMAAGIPPVVTAVGGLIDTVVDRVTGVHVPPRDPAALASAAKWLLRDSNVRRQLGANGRERVRRLYGWKKVAKATEAVYDGLVAATLQTGAYA